MIYDSPSDAMMASARNWLEFVMISPSNEREFQRRIAAIGGTESANFDEGMILAQAALMAADVPEIQAFSSWYRERASMLFCQAL